MIVDFFSDIIDNIYKIDIRHVVRLTDCALHLSNQDTVAISRARMAGVKEKLNRFWGEEGW